MAHILVMSACIITYLYHPYTWSQIPNMLNQHAARVVVPVLDAYVHEHEVGKQYPLSCKNPTRYCHRAHQLIHHERVYVVKTHADRAHVRVHGCQWSNNPEEGCLYWVDRHGLILEDELPPVEKEHLSTGDYTNNHPEVVLIKPHRTTQGTLLSVGTCARIERTSSHGHWVWILDGQKKMFHLVYLPLDTALIRPNIKSSLRKRLSFFVHLLRTIAQPSPPDNYIPYVWGGASGLYHIARHNIIQQSNDCFYAPEQVASSGFDCSGLVWRCAQAAGLTWPWRNTSMMYTHGKQLKPGAPLRAGDLIVWPGHVIIITSSAGNLITHAEGYTALSGKGAIHTTTIQAIFPDITTLLELKRHIDQKKPLLLGGQTPRTVTQARVLRIVHF